MSSYTVKQIAAMLNTNEETVRRWIRSGKLNATWTSKKGGNVISSAALNKFISETPKYAKTVTSSVTSSPLAMSVIVGGLLGGMIALFEEKKHSSISSSDIESFLKKKIQHHEKVVLKKRDELQRIQSELESEQQELEKYKYALEHLDLDLLAFQINDETK